MIPMKPDPLSSHSVYADAVGLALERDLGMERLDSPPVDGRGVTPMVRFSGDVRTMHGWCRRNEGLVIRERMTDATVIAGFQRLSRIVPVGSRYRRLAETCREVHVMGTPDHAPQLDGAKVHRLRRGRLSNEWFLLVRGARYKALLVARDRDGFESGIPMNERRFEAIATHHPGLVDEVHERLLGVMQRRGRGRAVA